MDKTIFGICPTCYLVVTSDQPNVSITGSNESTFYHHECEPNRMKYMRDNAQRWKEDGESCRKLRESFSHTINELSEYLGVSESKLRKFEAGKPVTHARLVSMSYRMYFELFQIRMSSNQK
jgi:DNA-binding transcriptional regulator YiaG